MKPNPRKNRPMTDMQSNYDLEYKKQKTETDSAELSELDSGADGWKEKHDQTVKAVE